MTRRNFIEMALRQIYAGYVSDDSEITVNLVNVWLEQGIAIAAKANYTDSIKIDGIGYVNNSFYTTYKDIAITPNERFSWKIQLPQIPVGIGHNEGLSLLRFKDTDGQISFPLIPLTENQRTYFQTMRPIPNKTLFYYEGDVIYVISAEMLSGYTAQATMISGGDSTNLDSTLNVPSDYYPAMVTYIQQQLILERMQPKDSQNDGADFVKTT